jgi:hypothetical protein
MEDILGDQGLQALLAPEEVPMEQQRDDSAHLQFTQELTESKILAKTKKYESSFDKFKSTYEKNLKTAYNAYKNQQVTQEGVSVKIPEIFALIETELPHLLNSIFGQSMIVDATPKFDDPTGARTYKVKNYINRLIKDNCDGRKKTEAIIKNMLIYGTSVVKIYWDQDPDHDVDVMSGNIIDVESSHPNFDLVDPYTFAWDLSNESHEVKNCEWLRERIFISKDKMKVLRDNGGCGWFEDDEMTSTENKGKSERQKGSTASDDASSSITYYDEYSATIYSKDDSGKYVANEYIIWVLSGNKVIKFIMNPQKTKMYAVVRAYENPGEFMGLGEPDVVGALSSHLSYVHYQLGKLTKKVGQHLTVVTPAANISPENLRRIEEGVIFVDNAAGISFEQQMDSQDLKALIGAKEYLDEQISSVTGIGKALAGDSIGDVTATQASYVYQNASNRLALKLTHLQENFVKVLAENFFLLSKQLLTAPTQFFDLNNNLLQLAPEDFLGNYNWNAVGSIMAANKALQLQQNQQLIQQIIGLCGASMQSPNPITFDGLQMLQTLIAPNVSVPDMSKFVFPISEVAPPPGQAPLPGQGPIPQQPGNGPVPPQGPMDPNGQAMNIGTPNQSIEAGDIEQQASTLKLNPSGR